MSEQWEVRVRSRGIRMPVIVMGAACLVSLGVAFPSGAQTTGTLLFLSDRHGETLCDQTWFDVYALESFPLIQVPSTGVGVSSFPRGAGRVVHGKPLPQEGEARRLTDAGEQTPDAEAYCSIGYHRAVFSPDGSMIAAIRREGSSQVVVVMNADGSEQRVVSHPQESHATSVSWAPDGRRLVHDGHDVPGLKIVSIDGGEPTIIPDTQFVADPAWSNDGQWIAFTYAPEENNPRFRNGLGVIAPDGTGRRLVTLDPDIAAAARPAWSPDDSEIAFSTQNPGCGGERVSIVPFEGASEYETLPLPDDMCRSGGPAWLSDSTLAFWGAVGTGEPDLYAMRRGDPASLVQLTSAEGVDVDPTVVFATAPTDPDPPRTDGEPGRPGDTTDTGDAESAAGRAPLLVGGVVAAVVVALLVGRTVLATAGTRAGRARARERDHDRSSDHGGCETRWEAASERARASRASTGAALDASLSDVRMNWGDLIGSLESARAAFEPIRPSADEPDQDEEMATVERLLGSVAEITTEEGTGR